LSYEVAGRGEVPGLGGGMRRLVEEGRTGYGGWCLIPSALAAEAVSASGCDWLCIDQQHGQIDDAAMRAMVQATAIRRMPTVVRVPWNEPAAIMVALDAGADGVIIPMINTRAEAERAASAAHYPPLGNRSWGPVRSGMARHDFSPASANSQAVCLVMIETAEAVGNLDAILDVAGVDGVLVGPSDLTISHTGETSGAAKSERDVEMITKVGEGCKRRGLAAAIALPNIADAKRWEGAGFTLFALPGDAALIGQGVKAAIETAKSGH
jgi:4-hydroxy-2-oxoheptanedioate aldolase